MILFFFFAALMAPLWLDVLSGYRALFYDVLFRMFYPNAVFLRRCLLAGEFPFWNPHIYAGIPFMQNMQTALFYPFTYLYVLFPFPAALALGVWLHGSLAACFMHRFCRFSGFSREAAVLAAVVYACNGYFIAHYAYPSNFNAYIWLPLLLVYLKKAVAAGSWPDALSAGFVLALEAFAGHPQFTLYAALAAGIFTLLEASSGSCWAAAAALVICGLSAALFTAIQWLPALPLIVHSSLASERSYAWATTYSLVPTELWRMLLMPLWNRYFSPSGDPHIVGLYFGLPALGLACAGSLPARGGKRPERWSFIAIALCGFLLALGRYLPLYRFLYAALPPLRWFRFPAQALFLCCFGVAALAGLGLDRLGLRSRKAWAVIALVFIDLWLFSRRAIITIDPRFYDAQTKVPAFLRANAREYRFMLTPRTRAQDRRAGKSELDAWLEFRDSLVPDLSMAEGLFDAGGNEQLRYERYDRALRALSRDPLSPWMDALSVRYLLSFWDMPGPKFRLARAGSVRVYENAAALPRAYYSRGAVYVQDGRIEEYLDAHPHHDFREAILLEDPFPVARDAKTAAAPATVNIRRMNPNSSVLEAQAPTPGWVVMTDAYDSGWSATVNGASVRVWRVNLFQRGVRVDAGRAIIKFRYMPPYFYPAALLSLASLAAALLALRRSQPA